MPNTMKNRIYLDWNATAPLSQSAKTAMNQAMDITGNPSSQHQDGQRAMAMLENARKSILTSAGLTNRTLIFNSGATEGLNTALRGFNRHILIGAGDHTAVRVAANASGQNVTVLPITSDGLLDLSALQHTLDEVSSPALLVITMANNDTGVIQPLDDILPLIEKRDVLVLCDAVQVYGRGVEDITAQLHHPAIACIALSAHKFGGPKGMGALICHDCPTPKSLILGGGQELNHRAGTQNLIGAVGMVAALEDALTDWSEIEGRRNRLEARLKAHAPELIIFGEHTRRLPNTSRFAISGWQADIQLMQLDLAGFAISAGSACTSGKAEPSHVLLGMGYDASVANCAIRVSLGPHISDTDIDQFINAWTRLYDMHQH